MMWRVSVRGASETDYGRSVRNAWCAIELICIFIPLSFIEFHHVTKTIGLPGKLSWVGAIFKMFTARWRVCLIWWFRNGKVSRVIIFDRSCDGDYFACRNGAKCTPSCVPIEDRPARESKPPEFLIRSHFLSDPLAIASMNERSHERAVPHGDWPVRSLPWACSPKFGMSAGSSLWFGFPDRDSHKVWMYQRRGGHTMQRFCAAGGAMWTC